MQFTSQQEKAIGLISDWYRSGDQLFTLGGYAGTGKTTIARQIQEDMAGKQVFFAAFTGKAANVLRDKGIANSSTIHRLLYKAGEKSRKKLMDLTSALEKERHPEEIERLKKAILAEKRRVTAPVFALNDESPLRAADLIVVDEYSMIDQRLLDDLLSLGKKVLALGDPFQLPPVGGESPLEPDFFLTEVHRQALDSHILRLATALRDGEDIVEDCNYSDFRCLDKTKVSWEEYRDASQVIVGRNKTKADFNKRYRAKMGYDGELPQHKERLICLKNNHELNLFNGMMGSCRGVSVEDADTISLDFEPEDGSSVNYAIPTWVGRFYGNEPEIWQIKELNQFEFGYAITCHKSQGSEFDDIIVFHEPVGRTKVEHRRWLYTAITRAKRRCTLVT